MGSSVALPVSFGVDDVKVCFVESLVLEEDGFRGEVFLVVALLLEAVWVIFQPLGGATSA